MWLLSVNTKNQKGFSLLLVAVVLVAIASLWLSSQNKYLVSVFETEQLEGDMAELKMVKAKLLQFAVLQPEIYKTDTSGVMQDASQIPSPGYFPCPDLDGDGQLSTNETSCGNPFDAGSLLDSVTDDDTASGYVPDPELIASLGTCNGTDTCLGFVPSAISTRDFYFGEAGKFYYFLDERFSTQNPNYVNDNLKRFAPLNPIQFDTDDGEISNDPVLTLDGVTGYIALIIDPGSDGLDTANKDGDYHFSSSGISLQNADATDKIVGITYNEWLALMAHRICPEKKRIEGIVADYTDINNPLPIAHWYNDYDLTSNPGGSNWRTWGIVCP